MPFPDHLDIPGEVRRIAERLEAEGFETWCVGGAIRDNLLGETNKDFDLATAAQPEDVRRLFHRTIPIGIEHGTVAVLDHNRKPHEITTFRRDVKTDGRHAAVEFGVSIDEDLARRDFTINAIAYHPTTRAWLDPFDGEGDLARRVIRAVGDAAQRFREDYLRILRAIRFAARFGFEIDERTWEAAKQAAEGLRRLSAERVREEWFKGLETARRPGELVRLWEEVGARSTWMSEVAEGAGGREEGAVDRLPRDPVLITAFLSSEPATTLERLKCSRAEVDRGARIGRLRGSEPSGEDPVALRRWLAQVGPVVDDLLAVRAAEGGDPSLAAAVDAVRTSGAALDLGDLAIDGNTLREMGLAEGPLLGRILRTLLDDVLEDPRRNVSDYLLARARELAEAHEG
jgi:tRNA nucleotidyltransferase (CCA-adding enzyme)